MLDTGHHNVNSDTKAIWKHFNKEANSTLKRESYEEAQND